MQKDTRQSYETHNHSRIKSTSLLQKRGISACLLFMRSISLIYKGLRLLFHRGPI